MIYDTYPLAPYIIPLVVVTVILAIASSHLLWRGQTPQSRALAFSLLAIIGITLGYVFELSSTNLTVKLFWYNVQFFGYIFLNVTWLIFIFHFTGRERWTGRRTIFALSVVPGITLVLAATNHVHHLVIKNVVTSISDATFVIEHTLGAWGWVTTLYSILLLAPATYLLIEAFVHARGIFRNQMIALSFAPFFALGGMVLENSGLNFLAPISLIPFAFGLSGLAIIGGILIFRMGNVLPVARETIVERMHDAMITLDALDRIVDVNAAAKNMIAQHNSKIIGQPLRDVLPQLAAQLDLSADQAGHSSGGTEVALDLDAVTSSYDVTISQLHDLYGNLMCKAIVLRNITGRERMEQALQQTNTELRNIQSITQTLLSMDDFSEGMQTVAEGIVNRLGFEYAWISRYVEEEQVYVGMAFAPMSGRFFNGLSKIPQAFGHPEWSGNVQRVRIPYQLGQNALMDRLLLDGDLIISDSLSDIFMNWLPKGAIVALDAVMGDRTHILVPLRIGGKTLGEIHVAVPKGTWSANREQMLQRLAGQAALVIEKSKLLEEEQKRTAALSRSNTLISALSRVGSQMGTTVTLESVLETLGSELRNLNLGCVIWSLKTESEDMIMLYTTLESSLQTIVEKMMGAKMVGYRLRRERWMQGGVIKDVVETGKPQFRNDPIPSISDAIPGISVQTVKRVFQLTGFPTDLKSIHLPLTVNKQTIGTIAIWGAALEKTDTPTLAIFANQVAVAIEKAQLFAAEQQKSAELKRSNAIITALSQVAARIEATRDPDEVFDALGTELKQLGLTCYLALLDPDTQMVVGRYTSIESKLLTGVENLTGLSLNNFKTRPDQWGTIFNSGQQEIYAHTSTAVTSVFSVTSNFSQGMIKRIFQLLHISPDFKIISLPLPVKERVIGALSLWGIDVREEDVPALTIFASQVAGVIERMQLYEIEQQRLAELEHSNALVTALGQVAARIETALEPDHVLETLGAELKKLNLMYFLGLYNADKSVLMGQYTSIDSVILKQVERLTGFTARNFSIPVTRWPLLDDLQPGQTVFVTDPVAETARMLPGFPKKMAEQITRWIGVHATIGYLAIPLSFEDRIFGVFFVWGAGMTEEDIPALSVFAGQVAGTLERARLYEIEIKQRILAETLRDTAAALNSTLNLEDTLENILELLGRVMAYNRASIHLADDNGDFYLASGRGYEDMEQARAAVRALNGEHVWKRFKSQKELVIPDTYADERWLILPGMEDVRCWMGAPLLIEGRIIGILNVDNLTANLYDAATGKTVMAFANQAAIAIQNARLHEQVKRHTIDLEQRILERTAELVQANQDMETLLHVISHDLKEPLRAIQSFSRMVNRQYADQLDDRGQDFLWRVERAGKRMQTLLDNILTLSRVQRMEAPTAEVSSEAVVREVLEQLEMRIQETAAAIHIAPNLPQLRANRTWVTQAVYNLVVNALKFTISGEPPEIEIGPYAGPEGVGLVVKDRGPGVPPDFTERIFQLFQRAVGRDVEGTGAGLAIVRQIAERHGGQAWVQPRRGGGSEFMVTFGKAAAPLPREVRTNGSGAK